MLQVITWPVNKIKRINLPFYTSLLKESAQDRLDLKLLYLQVSL